MQSALLEVHWHWGITCSCGFTGVQGGVGAAHQKNKERQAKRSHHSNTLTNMLD
jgi:hypothetical protein